MCAWFILLLCISCSATQPEVTIKWGTIRGFEEKVLDKKVNIFLGIPFAEPPIDELRFTKSIPLRNKANGVYQANKWPKACLELYELVHINDQARSDHPIERSEDCLFLNIWSPVPLDGDQLKPVLVYIHGGGFIAFSSTDSNLVNGKYLSLLGDFVVVTFNYRQGPFGFLAADDPRIPGNAGLHDQALALEWVHDNIQYFGGDPNMVTLSGTSAGSISASFQLFSSWSNRFFHRVMLFSGTPFTLHLQTKKESVEKMNELASLVGCKSDDKDKQIDCLKVAPPQSLLSGYVKMIYRSTKFRVHFLPSDSSEFFSSPFVDLMKSKSWPSNVTVLLSTTRDDGSFMTRFNAGPKEQTSESYVEHIKFLDSKGFSKYEGLLDDIVQLYFSPNGDGSVKDIKDSLVYYYNDRFMQCPSLIFGQLLAQTNTVYNYKFNDIVNKTKLNAFSWLNKYGSEHGEDLISFFGLPFLKREFYDEKAREISQNFIKMIKVFVYHGRLPWPSFGKDKKGRIIPFTHELSFTQPSLFDFTNSAYFNCQYIKKLFRR